MCLVDASSEISAGSDPKLDSVQIVPNKVDNIQSRVWSRRTLANLNELRLRR